MTAETATAELVNPNVVFADDEHGACCDCCEGYCPVEQGDRGDGYDVIVRLIINGVEYLGTNKLMLRRDLQKPLPPAVMERVIDKHGPAPLTMAVPDKKPKRDSRRQSASVLDRLDKSGLTRHYAPEVVHLYLGDEHAGWCMWNKHRTGAVDADLNLIREIAKDCNITLNAASLALNMARSAS